MKKKFLAMLMASVMVLGLAACGNSSQPAADSGGLVTPNSTGTVAVPSLLRKPAQVCSQHMSVWRQEAGSHC